METEADVRVTYCETTISGAEGSGATFVSFARPLPGTPAEWRDRPEALAVTVGMHFREAWAAGAERSRFVARALFDREPLMAMIDQFDDRIERERGPDIVVGHELIDRATEELSQGERRASRFVAQLEGEQLIAVAGSSSPASLETLFAGIADVGTAIIGTWAAATNPSLLLMIAAPERTIFAGAPAALAAALETGLRAMWSTR